MNDKQRYHRILRTGDSEYDVDDEQSTDGALSLDGAGSGAGLHRTVTGKKAKQRVIPQRRGSHGSLASYRSLASVDDNEGIVVATSPQSNDTTYEDALENCDDVTDEVAPFRGSFDQEEQIDHTESQLQQRQALPPQNMTKGSPSSPVDSNTPVSRSPMQSSSFDYPSFAYSSSFDLEDDDDDDEAGLKRYNLDFSASLGQQTMTTSLSQHGSPGHPSNSNDGVNDSHSRASFSYLSYAWYSFQSLRQQARQRRAQRLLQQSERNLQQTIWICVMTYCDATDRGIILMAFIILVWSLLVVKAPSGTLRGWLLVVGVCLFIVRVGARPAFEYIKQRTSRRRRLKEMQQNQQTQQRTRSQEPGARTPPGRYLDQPVPIAVNGTSSDTSSNNNNHLFIDSAATDNFELKPMRRSHNSPSTSILLTHEPTRNGSPTNMRSPDPAIHTV